MALIFCSTGAFRQQTTEAGHLRGGPALTFLYHHRECVFFGGMKKHKTLIKSIVAAVVIVVIPFIPWGKFWGTEVEYYEDGSKHYETPYRFFKEHGTDIYYNQDGWKVSESVYENGKRIAE